MKQASTRNPEGNSVLKRTHQVTGNMIKKFQVYARDNLDENDPCSEILSAVMFAIRSTYHTTLEATPV